MRAYHPGQSDRHLSPAHDPQRLALAQPQHWGTLAESPAAPSHQRGSTTTERGVYCVMALGGEVDERVVFGRANNFDGRSACVEIRPRPLHYRQRRAAPSLGAIAFLVLFWIFQDWATFIHWYKGSLITPWDPGVGILFAVIIHDGILYSLALFIGVVFAEFVTHFGAGSGHRRGCAARSPHRLLCGRTGRRGRGRCCRRGDWWRNWRRPRRAGDTPVQILQSS